MSSAWHETFAERLDDDYAAAAQPRRITGRELVEHITARPAWLDLPVHLLAMTDDAEWLNEIDRDCYEPDEGDVLALLAHEDGCPRAANPKARCGCVLAAKATRLLRAERDAAKTRAEQAEAALAEMRERLGNAEVEWAARWRESNGEEVYRSSSTEADARHFVRLWRERGLPGYVTGLEVVSALIGEWQNAEAPRTVSERAADEQGDGEGGDA